MNPAGQAAIPSDPVAVPIAKGAAPMPGAFAVLAIAVCALLVKLPVLGNVKVYWEDSYWFCLLAQNLEAGRYSAGGVPHARFFPGYPLTIAGVDLMLGRIVPLPLLAAWLTALTTSLAAGLCLPLFRRWGLGELGSGLAILGVLMCSSLNLYGALPLYEGFFALFVVLALLLEAKGRRSWAAVIAGCASVVKPEGVFLVLGVALAAHGWGARLRGLILGGLPLVPWLVRNQLVLGSPLHSEYGSIYQGFAESGIPVSGLDYLLNYPDFFGPFVMLLALPALPKMRRLSAAALYGAGTLLLHLLWPGDLERYVLPHFPLVFFLFGSTLERIGSRMPRLTTVASGVVLAAFLALHYPDRILAEVTRSVAYGAVALKLAQEKGDFTVLGPDHAALAVISGRFAFSAWHQLGRPPILMVAELVRKHKLRYHVVTNYYNIDRRFSTLRDGGNVVHRLADGSSLYYQPVLLTVAGYSSAEPENFGLTLKTATHTYQAILYRLNLVGPEGKQTGQRPGERPERPRGTRADPDPLSAPPRPLPSPPASEP